MTTQNRIGGVVSIFAEWVVKRPFLCLGLSLVILLFAASGMKNLAFTSSYKVFFSKANPFLQSYESMQKVYSNGDSALIVVEPKKGDVFDRDFLVAIEELTDAAWQIPSAYRVDSITNFQHTRATGDDIEVRKLVPDASRLTVDDLRKIQNIALSEPLLVRRIISDKGDVTAVNVSVRLPDGDDLVVAEVAASVRALRDRFEAKYPDINIYLTGVAMMSNAFPEISMQEMSTTTPIMFLIVLLVTFLVLRSLVGTIATFLVVIFSIVTALGIAGHMGIKLNQVSANVPVIVLTLAVADCIHVLTTIIHQMRNGMKRRDAIVESLKINFSPVFVTTVTTAIGFLGLNLSDAPPFHDLGNMTAIGMLAALVYSLLFVPAFIRLVPLGVKPRETVSWVPINRLSSWVIRHRNVLLYSTVGLGFFMLALLPRLTVDENFVDNFAKGLEIRDDSDFTQENLTGLFNMEFSLHSDEQGGVNSPEFLEKVDEFALWSRSQKGVLHVNAITDTLKRINRSVNGDDESYYKLPQSRDQAAQYFLVYEMSLPLGLDLNDQINVDRSSTKVTVTFDDLSTFEMQRAKEDHEKWLVDNAPTSMHAEAASASLMYTYLMNTNIKGLLIGTIISFILITLCLSIVFRSLKYGLVSLLPNILPISMAFGLWSVVDGVVGVAAATIATMTLGIVVDDTVHFVSKYLRAKNELNMEPRDAVRYAFSTVGVAVLSTSLIFIFGFGSMIHSNFLMNAQMGIFTVMTVFFALLLDFFLLPTLLIRIDDKSKVDEIVIVDEPLMTKI